MLCRVCAVLLTGYKYDSKQLDVLQKMFVVAFAKDVVGVHPPYLLKMLCMYWTFHIKRGFTYKTCQHMVYTFFLI